MTASMEQAKNGTRVPVKRYPYFACYSHHGISPKEGINTELSPHKAPFCHLILNDVDGLPAQQLSHEVL